MLDFVGLLAPAEKTGNTHYLVIVDEFSKFTVLVAISVEVTAEHTARCFFNVWLNLFSVPERVILGRGPQFTAEV